SNHITPETAELPPPPATAPPEPPPVPPRPTLSQIERVSAEEARVSGLMQAVGAAKTAAEAMVDGVARRTQALATTSRDTVRGAAGRLFRPRPPREVDRFGRDPHFERDVLRFFEVLYRHYFRVSVRGMENVPRTGPA